MFTRRKFLKIGAASLAALYTSTRADFLLRAFAQQGTPLAGGAIPKFIEPLPLLSVAGGPMETIIAGTSQNTLTMQEFRANMLPNGFILPNGNTYNGTWAWGYRTGEKPTDPAGTYIGPVIVASRGTPTEVKFVNNLPDAPNMNWRDWTDQTLHWADPLNSEANACAHGGEAATGDCLSHYAGPIPTVPHLHGGEIPAVIDGGPDAWFTSDGAYHGHAFYSKDSNTNGDYAIYRYPNSQEAAMIWFHDHLLGGTRLNVYAGLAGAYVLIDPGLSLPSGLHPVGLQQGSGGSVDYLIPLVLQDRMFDTDGQLYFPNIGINPEHPYWIPEFVGDTIVVNGKAWPFLNVEPRRYRFLFINGSNARSYEMFLANPVTKALGPAIWQIGTDGGYLDTPVKIDPNAAKPALTKLALMPGERADVIVDFSGFAGQTLLLRNTGRTPYDKGTPPPGSTLGQIMLIRVGTGLVTDASYNPANGVPLHPPMIRLVDPAAGTLAAGVNVDKTRQLTLNEVIGAGGPLEILVNNTKWDGMYMEESREDFTSVETNEVEEDFSELPNEGDTEVWEIVNLTADVHPIHTHLVQFQLLNRQKFNTNKYNKAYTAAFPGGAYIPAYGPPLNYNTGNALALGGNPDITPFLQGPIMPPDANEAGWKDTIKAFPGQVTRFAVRFAPTDKALDDPNLYFSFDPDAGGHGYVWHCHIIDHEDNEMMRPYKVNPKDATRSYVMGEDY